jgi:hypothetical protein
MRRISCIDRRIGSPSIETAQLLSSLRAFPDEALERLVGALLLEQNDEIGRAARPLYECGNNRRSPSDDSIFDLPPAAARSGPPLPEALRRHRLGHVQDHGERIGDSPGSARVPWGAEK